MSGEIIVSDALAKMKEEIQILKAKLAELLQERDGLIYHICPELRARYAAEIGDYQNRANYQELMILELKRRIEIARAALNREQSISEEEVDEQIEKEYQEFHQKVDEEYQKSKRSQEEQAQKEEKRKFYEEQWKSQYGKREEGENTEKDADTKTSGTEDTSKGSNVDDTEDNDIKPKENPLPNAKELYRKIVKKLHPDMNPDVTEHELELFHRAAKAYAEGDIMTLQAIYDEIYGLDNEVLSEEESMEALLSIREQLLEGIAKAVEEIETIKGDFPYTEKDFLDNPEAVKAKQDAIIQLIQEYEKEIIRLSKLLEEVNREMEELQKKKRDKAYE